MWGGRSESSFRNRLVVREITIQVHGFCLSGLKLGECFVGQRGKLILAGSERFSPPPCRVEFSEDKRSESILLGFRKLGRRSECVFEKLSHGRRVASQRFQGKRSKGLKKRTPNSRGSAAFPLASLSQASSETRGPGHPTRKNLTTFTSTESGPVIASNSPGSTTGLKSRPGKLKSASVISKLTTVDSPAASVTRR